MKRIFLFLLSSLLITTLSACNRVNQDFDMLCKQDLIKTLDEIKSSTTNESSYIYSSNLSATSAASDASSEINKKIAGLVEYSILGISADEETAEASVKLIVPDVYKLITEIAAGMQENNVDLLLERLNEKIDGDMAMKEYEVTVALKLVDEHWFLIPSGELANAFSGGIIEQYSMMGQNIIEGLLEGESND